MLKNIYSETEGNLDSLKIYFMRKAGKKWGGGRCYYGKPSIDPCMVVK